MDWKDCKWIVRSYMDWKIAGFGTGGVVLPIPPLCQKIVPKSIVSVVVELCRLYLDCVIVFGLFNCGIWHRGCSITYTPFVPKICAKKNCVDCSWIVSIVVELYDCRTWHRGCTNTYTPPCKKNLPKKIESLAFGLCGLNLDCSDCMWINTRPEADL